MEYTLIIGKNFNLTNYDYNNKYVIGVDNGAYLAYQNNIKLDEAVGDFDSISIECYNSLKNYTKITKLNPIKDATDTAYAISLCKNASKIDILGSIQGYRIEHFIANILELIKNPIINLIDNNSKIFVVDKIYKIKKNEYKFISFYSIDEETTISLKGFKYELSNYCLKRNDTLCISNEIINVGNINTSGRLLVIMSKDDNNEVI